MADKKVGLVVGAAVLALGAGLLVAKSTGVLGGSGDSAAEEEGPEGKSGGKGRKRAGSTGAGAREGAEGAESPQEGDAAREPEPEPGSYAYRYRTAKAELEMAKHDLEHWREWSRFPESARPAEEMAPGGGLLPHYTAPTRLPLTRRGPDGKPDDSYLSKSRVVLVQDRFQVSVGETVTMKVHALSEKDQPLPVRCSSVRALAQVEGANAPPPFEFPCAADKENGVVAVFDPARSPFRSMSASIVFRFDLEVDRDDGVKESGTAEANIHYVATSPGRFTGAVRQAYENGSVAFYLGYEVAQPGFFRLNVRADSGQDDKVFAHINVRQQVDKAGPTEIRAELFGKLIVDNQVKTVRLRDLDGEYVPPAGEIASVPGRDGVFHTATIDASKVKGDEWSSPEKDDRTKHYEEMLKKAQEDCDKNYDGCTK
jgi:hypothetical protein